MPPHWNPDEATIRTLNRYGRENRDTFGGLYIDRDTHAGIVVQFTEDAATHEAALLELLPDTPLTVKKVRFSESALMELQERIGDEHEWVESTGLSLYSTGLDIIDNVVELTGGSNDPTSAGRIYERFGRQMLRIVAYEIEFEPEQPLAGEGWRLLAELPRGGIYSVAAFTEAESFRREWQRLEAGELPAVDFEEEIIVRFSPAISGSCRQVHFAGLVVTSDRVHGDITFPTPQGMACTSDANPYAFMVAVERSLLPEGQFTLQLSDELVGDAGDQVVVLDLGS